MFVLDRNLILKKIKTMTKLGVGVSSMRYLFVAAITAAIIWGFSDRTLRSEASVPPPIAVVDVTKVLTQSKAGKAAYDSLKQLQEQGMQTAKTMDDEVRKMDTAVNADKLKMTEDQLAKANGAIADKRIAMQRYAQDTEREIGEARARAGLDAKVKPVIDALGKEMDLWLVFNKFESGLVYASDAVDITDTIITRLNAVTP